MNVYVINPLSDSRWDGLVNQHAAASAFHRGGWLEALRRTYGYQPLAITSCAPDRVLSDGMVFCRICSAITGSRLVSLPFADHCQPMLNDPHDVAEFMNWLSAERNISRWKYIEIRPLSQIADLETGIVPDRSYCFHELDLTLGLEQIFSNFHRDSIQRRIQRAEREKLFYEVGRSDHLLDEFYHLMMMTRRRHLLLPQPRVWFKNLLACMGSNAQIRLARKDGISIAAMLTLRHRNGVTYKYGCSNEQFHNIGAMPFLFWQLVQESKAAGVEKIDFGRSDLDQQGLITFKDKFGTTRRPLNYFRYPAKVSVRTSGWAVRAIRQFFSMLPDFVSSTAGRIVYKHIG
jgi:hypothetical protein